MLRDRTCLLTVGLVVLLCTAGWAKDTKPKLALTDTVTKDGITWQFSGKAQVGQFVNGDYYVVGPVTVVAITPKPGPGRNGSVLNLPPDQGRSPFDDRAEGERYDSGLRAEPPVPMHPGDALISSISVEQVGDLPAPLRPGDKSLSPVRTVSVLTCLDKPVPADAFRPSYCRKPRGPGEPAQTPSVYLAGTSDGTCCPGSPARGATRIPRSIRSIPVPGPAPRPECRTSQNGRRCTGVPGSTSASSASTHPSHTCRTMAASSAERPGYLRCC